MDEVAPTQMDVEQELGAGQRGAEGLLGDEMDIDEVGADSRALGLWFTKRWCRGHIPATEVARGAQAAVRSGSNSQDALL